MSGTPAPAAPDQADLERRFGGLRRLYGPRGYERLRAARVAVVGVGGVGSWAAEALARSGVAALAMIDLDHVSESNVNRQVQALGATLGMAKVQALALRLRDVHPGCAFDTVEAFVEAGNWPALLPGPVDGVIDCCDQTSAKQVLAAWALATGTPLVCVGAAGGKRAAQRVEVDDLADTTHDPLLAGLRARLRRAGVAPRQGRMGLRCVYSREPVALPAAAHGDGSVGGGAEGGGEGEACAAVDGSLNCHGYGSSVTVTATFGLVAAGVLIEQIVGASTPRAHGPKTVL